MTGWNWHQLDLMQIIFTSLQTHNHSSSSPLSIVKQILYSEVAFLSGLEITLFF